MICAQCKKPLVDNSNYICLACWKKSRDQELFLILSKLTMTQEDINWHRCREIWQPGMINEYGKPVECNLNDFSFDPDILLFQDEFEWFWKILEGY